MRRRHVLQVADTANRIFRLFFVAPDDDFFEGHSCCCCWCCRCPENVRAWTSPQERRDRGTHARRIYDVNSETYRAFLTPMTLTAAELAELKAKQAAEAKAAPAAAAAADKSKAAESKGAKA